MPVVRFESAALMGPADLNFRVNGKCSFNITPTSIDDPTAAGTYTDIVTITIASIQKKPKLKKTQFIKKSALELVFYILVVVFNFLGNFINVAKF